MTEGVKGKVVPESCYLLDDDQFRAFLRRVGITVPIDPLPQLMNNIPPLKKDRSLTGVEDGIVSILAKQVGDVVAYSRLTAPYYHQKSGVALAVKNYVNTNLCRIRDKLVKPRDIYTAFGFGFGIGVSDFRLKSATGRIFYRLYEEFGQWVDTKDLSADVLGRNGDSINTVRTYIWRLRQDSLPGSSVWIENSGKLWSPAYRLIERGENDHFRD